LLLYLPYLTAVYFPDQVIGNQPNNVPDFRRAVFPVDQFDYRLGKKLGIVRQLLIQLLFLSSRFSLYRLFHDFTPKGNHLQLILMKSAQLPNNRLAALKTRL